MDADYHRKAHASLLGQTPRQRYLAGKGGRALTPGELAKALEVTSRRRVRKDGTFSADSVVYEVEGRHLFGRWVDLVEDGLTGKLLEVSHQGVSVRFAVCDPVANSRRKRAPLVEAANVTRRFDPIASLLQRAREVGDE